ncbi:hypothetical protein IWX50DRAFT_380349 [Phyllosticta citricarpa]
MQSGVPHVRRTMWCLMKTAIRVFRCEWSTPQDPSINRAVPVVCQIILKSPMLPQQVHIPPPDDDARPPPIPIRRAPSSATAFSMLKPVWSRSMWPLTSHRAESAATSDYNRSLSSTFQKDTKPTDCLWLDSTQAAPSVGIQLEARSTCGVSASASDRMSRATRPSEPSDPTGRPIGLLHTNKRRPTVSTFFDQPSDGFERNLLDALSSVAACRFGSACEPLAMFSFGSPAHPP